MIASGSVSGAEQAIPLQVLCGATVRAETKLYELAPTCVRARRHAQ